MIRMETKALAIMLAPNPSDADIELQQKLDRMKNPHNDFHKPKIRERAEIIIDYKIEMYKLMLERISI